MTAAAAASCDPDYGWINGPEGSNKCYMVLRVGPGSMVTPPMSPGPGLRRLLPRRRRRLPRLELRPEQPKL